MSKRKQSVQPDKTFNKNSDESFSKLEEETVPKEKPDKAEKTAKTQKPKKISPYTVSVDARILLCRKSTSLNAEITGYVYRGEKLLIVEEKRGPSGILFGKIKSNVGWVNLEFCTKAV